MPETDTVPSLLYEEAGTSTHETFSSVVVSSDQVTLTLSGSLGAVPT